MYDHKRFIICQSELQLQLYTKQYYEVDAPFHEEGTLCKKYLNLVYTESEVSV